MTKSLFLASALAAGTVAQTTSVMNLFLDTIDMGNITLHGSVVSAAPDATTYSITSIDARCTTTLGRECPYDLDELERTFVNGPSTFAHHFIKTDAYTWDYECKISDRTNYNCEKTLQGASVESGYKQTEVWVWDATMLTPVTITAGLEKILAVSTATSATAQTAASASTGPSETSTSASATSSGPASSASTTASSAATGAAQNMVLAAVCGILVMMLGL